MIGRRRFFLALALTAASQAATAQPAKARTDLLRVSYIDVGQGDAIWIQGPKRADGKPGINVLIDGGPNSSADENHLLDYLSKYELKPGAKIDYIVATHPHDDHYPGLTTVLEKYAVKNIIDTGFKKDEGTAAKPTRYGRFILAAKNETGGKLIRLHEHGPGTVALDWGDDSAAPDDPDHPVIKAEILAGFWNGSKEFGAKQNTKENNCSTVIRMSFGKVSFLFMGDAEGKERKDSADTAQFVEELLLKNNSADLGKLRANVLKIGHHGSETSSTIPFIRAVRPAVLVVSSGRKDFNGVFLPDEPVLARYRKEVPGITIVRTDKDDEKAGLDTTNDADGDDIYAYSDGKSLRVFQAALVSGKWRWVTLKSIQPAGESNP